MSPDARFEDLAKLGPKIRHPMYRVPCTVWSVLRTPYSVLHCTYLVANLWLFSSLTHGMQTTTYDGRRGHRSSRRLARPDSQPHLQLLGGACKVAHILVTGTAWGDGGLYVIILDSKAD